MISQDSLGSLVCGGFQGTHVTHQAHELIVKYKISTMILSKKNAHSVPQMSKLIKDLQYIAFKEAGYKYPLAFAIDEEGGMMNSLFDSQSLSQFPGAMAMAATGNVELVYEVSRAIAVELRHIGFSIILGPVLDVVTKFSHQLVSVRSFGTTVEEVVKYGRACAMGLRDGGLITVGKHFPGIGNARVDSLLELPIMTDSLEQIRNFNSVPFAELIQDGLLDGVSAAGFGVPQISPDENHACLSPVLLTQLLRAELGFKGFVISECLEMDALYHSIGLGQGVVLAIYAGCDLVMVCHDFKLQVEAIESISTALDNGMLDESIINASLDRLEIVRKRLPSWSEIFPNGEQCLPELFKVAHADLWQKHQQLSTRAYRNSITLVRDYEGVLPLTQFFEPNSGDNLLILTPLLKPVYSKQIDGGDHRKGGFYIGEEVFKDFAQSLSLYQSKIGGKFNVLHTTYTANGLTALHEQLIENSKAVIMFTSEALRNMYQMGIAKYVSVLCGASPQSFSGGASHVSPSKPLVIVATSSPYDFFYTRNLGSAYLCSYDYTELALKEVAHVLMGDTIPQGCIPGEKKFTTRKNRKRRSSSVVLSSPEKTHERIKKTSPPKRRWLVDEFDLTRDWRGLIKLCKSNWGTEDFFLRSLLQLFHLNSAVQKHFVVRNSSLNILYGIVLTWIDEVRSSEGLQKIGRIIFILVDKSKRLQSIGKNLHARAMRYLTEEQGCKIVRLGSSLPLIDFSNGTQQNFENSVISFFNNSGWIINDESASKELYVMVLKNLYNWSVPPKIFRELTIVGVRFDICMHAEKLQTLIDKVSTAGADGHTEKLYKEALSWLDSTSPYEVKIIIALEPTNQSVIGSIILFTNKSQLARYYPFMENKVDKDTQGSLIGGIVCPVIDPAYSSLNEIFKFGLICTGITYLRSNFSEANTTLKMGRCFIMDVPNDKSRVGVEDIGFEHWRTYREYYASMGEGEPGGASGSHARPQNSVH